MCLDAYAWMHVRMRMRMVSGHKSNGVIVHGSRMQERRLEERLAHVVIEVGPYVRELTKGVHSRARLMDIAT